MDENTIMCPNCNVEMVTEWLSDIDAGTILISCCVLFCPDCLYIDEEEVKISNN